MGDSLHREGAPERAAGETEPAPAGLLPTSQIEDLEVRILQPFGGPNRPPADVRGRRRRDHRFAGEVEVEAEHPFPAGSQNGPVLAFAVDPGRGRPLAPAGRHGGAVGGQPQRGGIDRPGRRHRTARRRARHPERSGEDVPDPGNRQAARDGAGDGEGSLGRPVPRNQPRQGAGVPGRVAIVLEDRAGRRERAPARRVHQLVAGHGGRPVVEPRVETAAEEAARRSRLRSP